MQFRLVLLGVMLGLILSGCNGARVVDNIYDGGGRKYVVSEAMEYIGELPRVRGDRCSGLYCGPYKKASSRHLGDMFVGVSDGKVTEALVFIKMRTARGYYYGTLHGGRLEVDGVMFAEEFMVVGRESNDSYKAFAEAAGYEALDDGYVVISIFKNTSKTTRLSISYACARSMLPEGAVDDGEAAREFMRKMIRERVACM